MNARECAWNAALIICGTICLAALLAVAFGMGYYFGADSLCYSTPCAPVTIEEWERVMYDGSIRD